MNRHVFWVIKCLKKRGCFWVNKRTKNEKLKRPRWNRVTALRTELGLKKNKCKKKEMNIGKPEKLRKIENTVNFG